jgi:hypothetical protein
MENEKTIVVSGGLSFGKLLGVTFIILKLLNVITWSWLWVLAPIWIPYALLIGVSIILLIIGGIVAMFNNGY